MLASHIFDLHFCLTYLDVKEKSVLLLYILFLSCHLPLTLHHTYGGTSEGYKP